MGVSVHGHRNNNNNNNSTTNEKDPQRIFQTHYIKNNGNANPRPPDGLLVKHREERDEKKKRKKEKKENRFEFFEEKKNSIAIRIQNIFSKIIFFSLVLWKKMFIHYDIYIDLTFPYHHSKLLSSLKKKPMSLLITRTFMLMKKKR